MSIPSTRKLLTVNAILLAMILAVLLILNYDPLKKKVFNSPKEVSKTGNEVDHDEKNQPKHDSIKDDFEKLETYTTKLPRKIVYLMTTELQAFNWNEEFPYKDSNSMYHETIFMQKFPSESSPSKKLIVITFSNHAGNFCHAAAGRISLFEFRQKDQNWQMTRHYLAFGYGSDWGFEPEGCEIVRIGNNNKYAVIVHTSYSGTGGHDMQTKSVFMEVNHAFNLVFDFTCYEYYFNPPQDFEYTEGYSSMRIVESDKAYFDIETKSNAEIWDDNTDEADKRFIFNGKEYVEAKRKAH